MLKVEKYEYVRIGYRFYGFNKSKLARETGHSRNTIRKAVEEEYTGYKKRCYQPFPVMEPYTDTVDSWLEEDKERHSKQRHTARRVYHRLIKEHNFTGSESTVRRYVRQAKARLGLGGRKAFIPGLPDAGQAAEADWGDIHAVIAGETKRLKLFCLRSQYSGKCFVRAYPVERQQALFEAHMHAFVFFGGVFRSLVYDNLTTAVRKILKGKKRIEQDNFQKFRAYYTFNSRFCTPGEGHEKGGVEGLVGFSRRNFLVPIPEVDTLEELNEHLLKECMAYGQHVIEGREHSVDVLFNLEKEYLLSLPQTPYANELTISGKVDHYSTVIMDKNRYSVPTEHAGFRVQTVVSVDRVKIFHDGREIADHKRAYGNNKWVLDPDHYLDLLYQRPGAFDTARPIKQWRAQWPENHEQLLNRFEATQGTSKGTKQFIQVLMLYRDHDPGTVKQAVDVALSSGVSSFQAVRHLLISSGEETPPEKLQTWPSLPQADTSVYSQLGGALCTPQSQ